MTDRYAEINARIQKSRRAKGRRADEYDALIRAASHEIGMVAEAALGVLVDVAERVGLQYLEKAARTDTARKFRGVPEAMRAARFASSRLPGTSGRVVSNSSEWALRAALSVLREVRGRLEDVRQRTGPGEEGKRRRRKKPPASHKAY